MTSIGADNKQSILVFSDNDGNKTNAINTIDRMFILREGNKTCSGNADLVIFALICNVNVGFATNCEKTITTKRIILSLKLKLETDGFV